MNTRPDDQLFLSHIREAVSRIESYLEGISESEFMKSPLIQDGVVHQIQIIGEAAKRISPGLREQAPGIQWTDIAGMRNKIVHDYMHVDLNLIWEKATRDIPNLKEALRDLEDAK